MRSCLVEVPHIRIEHALELLLMKNQQMVETFLPYTPQEALADGIGSGSVIRDLEKFDVTCLRHPDETGSKLAIIIMNQVLGCVPIRVASRRCYVTQASVGDRVTPTWITFRDFSSMRKKAKSGRKNRSVTCKKSHAQICAA